MEVIGKVMKSTDPIGRNFTDAEMVSYMKRACGRQLIDQRRHRAVLNLVDLEDDLLADTRGRNPGQIAETREHLSVMCEAILSLSPKDQHIFRLRNLEHLSPTEVLDKTPGLTLRSYRKRIQRSNDQVSKHYQAILSGELCATMQESLLARSLAGTLSERQSRMVKVHLEHCRRCQQLYPPS